MKTRHVNPDSWDFASDVRAALREVKSFQNCVRVVNCGRGVVVLPDTNRKQDCTEGEVIKALGLVKKYDGLHLDNNAPEKKSERKLIMLRRSDDTPEWISLTPDQMRLLNWLQEGDYFWDEVEIQEMEPTGFKEI